MLPLWLSPVALAQTVDAVSDGCPGPVSVLARGLTSHGPAAFVAGEPGATIVPSGACTGAPLDVVPGPYRLVMADGAGRATVVQVPAGACGAQVQVVDLTTCTASAPAWLFDGDGDGVPDPDDRCAGYDDAQDDDGDGVPDPCEVVRVQAGGSHTCALFQDASLRCWGSNTWGALGLGDTDSRGDQDGEMGGDLPPVDLGTGRAAAEVALGELHTCALLDDGGVKCWGASSLGQLGLGSTAPRGDERGEMGDALPEVDLGPGRTALAVSTGTLHTCALLDDGSVKCWGYGLFGQLGLGSRTTLGDAANEMGSLLPAVDLGAGRTAVEVSAGGYHTCALLDDGSVKCWGQSDRGQLGQGTTTTLGDGPNEMGNALPPVDLGTGRTAVHVAAGFTHTCAVLDDGSVKCWGDGTSGQLGLRAATIRGDGPNEMGDALPAVDLGTGRTALSVATGNFHTCARLDDASVKCWGFNASGALGQGDTGMRGDAPGEMGNALPPIALGTGRTALSVTTGDYHTCARLDDGHAKCWGENVFGELGLGDAEDRGDEPAEMGDALPPVEL